MLIEHKIKFQATEQNLTVFLLSHETSQTLRRQRCGQSHTHARASEPSTGKTSWMLNHQDTAWPLLRGQVHRQEDPKF